MAGKKTGAKKKMAVATEQELKPVRVDLKPEDHDLLRMVAAVERKSMASYARDILSEHVRSEAKRLGLGKWPK